MGTDENFNAFFSLCNCFCEHNNVNLPNLLWKLKAPQRYEIGTGEGSHSATIEGLIAVKHSYFEVLDLAIKLQVFLIGSISLVIASIVTLKVYLSE